MAEAPRLTLQLKLVLRHALAAPGEWYGQEVADATGLPSGTVYPILARLRERGWIISRWETPADLGGKSRPLRRYYRLSPAGEAGARRALGALLPAAHGRKDPWP